MDKKWIEEFHKALEQRKEPVSPEFTPPPAKEATNPFVPYTPPDWVKKVIDWHNANPYGPLPPLRLLGWHNGAQWEVKIHNTEEFQ